MNNYGLYVHIPFCKKKCAYCDFYSICDTNVQERYTDALIKHIHLISESFKDASFDTVFVGGGTPTALTSKMLERIFDALHKKLAISDSAEISIEANPATLNREKLSVLKSFNVNRISIGLQSAQNNELKVLSRIHTFEEFLDTYFLVKEYVSNLNVDIMYGIPLQTRQSFLNTLEKLSSLNPDHLSVYGLRVEENTPFGRMGDKLQLPDENEFSEMYSDASRFLLECGYKKYEISNFSKEGKECKHNLKYWNSKEYIGIGPSAHSYVNGVRYSYKDSVEEYIDALSSGKAPSYGEYVRISNSDLLNEKIMLSLRLASGLNTLALLEEFKKDILKDRKDELDSFLSGKYIELLNDDTVRLTDKGMLVSNYIISELLY